MIEPAALQRYSLFGGLLEEDIAIILPYMENESFEKGDKIIVEGDRNDRIRFITEGKVLVSKGGVELTQFGEGNAFGEMEVLDVMPSAATITALDKVQTLAISNKCLYEMYKSDLKAYALFIMNLARDLSRRLRHMDEEAAKPSASIYPKR
jgi:CRP-like cAMP-binding protein